MSQWPPPQSPLPRQPQGLPVKSSNNGCWRAVAITITLAVAAIIVLGVASKRDRGFLPALKNSVGVVHINGPITDSEATVKAIRRLRQNTMIKALVLRLDTPGGGVAASEEIYREVLQARLEDDLPVIVSMGSVAASGGYYIASASDRIYATSGTITGSIGVIAPLFNAKETLAKLGMRQDSVVSGEHKDTGDPFSDPSASDRALMQGMVYDMYRQFFQVVLSARHKQVGAAVANGELDKVVDAPATKEPARALEWNAFTTGTIAAALKVPVEAETGLRRLADGRVFTGQQAMRVGLVDEIGTLQDAINYAGNAAGLGDDPATVEREPGAETTSWLGMKVQNFLREASASRRSLEFRSNF